MVVLVKHMRPACAPTPSCLMCSTPSHLRLISLFLRISTTKRKSDDNDEDEEEDGDYEVDFANMNVSPEILRMLGARYVSVLSSS